MHQVVVREMVRPIDEVFGNIPRKVLFHRLKIGIQRVGPKAVPAYASSRRLPVIPERSEESASRSWLKKQIPRRCAPRNDSAGCSSE